MKHSLPVIVLLALAGTLTAYEDLALPDARPVPAMQVMPLPYDQASFEHLGRELVRYHFGPALRRPFLYPLAGPAGRSLTRMGHPHDPVGHSHHNSVWISHADVGGVDFWGDRGGRIVHQRIDRFGDEPGSAWMLGVNAWQAPDGKTLMIDRRRIEIRPAGDDAFWVMLDLQLETPSPHPVTLGQTPFGLIGVRMAKTIGVHDGGGRIINSQGQVNEEDVFRKPARWVDYSGPVTDELFGGITLMDHPQNPGHPARFHVRNDGWMGVCLTLDGPITIEPDASLRLRYGLWVHADVTDREQCEQRWREFAGAPLPPITKQRL